MTPIGQPQKTSLFQLTFSAKFKMQNPIPFPQQNPKVSKSMTPAERKIWLAAKGAPPEMLLVTQLELAIIQRQLTGLQKDLAGKTWLIQETESHLDNYYRTEPDTPTAARHAVFDANRYHRVAERVAVDNAAHLEILEHLADNATETVVREALAFEVRNLRATQEFVMRQMAERFDRSGS